MGGGCCGGGAWHSVDTPTVGTAEGVEVGGTDEERLPEAGLVWPEKKTMQVADPTATFLQKRGGVLTSRRSGLVRGVDAGESHRCQAQPHTGGRLALPHAPRSHRKR